jgi:hypothetical protein
VLKPRAVTAELGGSSLVHMPEISRTWKETSARTFKVVVTTCSAGAALVSVLSFAQSHGLILQPPDAGAQGTAHAPGGKGARGAVDLDIAWIGVTPLADTAAAIGDTLHLTARVADLHGATVPGAAISWSSDSAEVAVVNADGSVIARGPGTTTIFAAAGSKLARARVTVRQRVADARIGGDSVARVAVGERRRLREEPLDARGHLVARRPALWRVADSSVAKVDSAGEIAGVAPGRTTVTVSVDGVSAQLPVEVRDVPASVTLASGDAQTAAVGRTLGRPVEVEVLSASGRPVAGVLVRFAPEGDAGRAEPAAAETDARGRARARWTLGDAPGRQSLTATVEGLAMPVLARAEGEPVAENVRTAPLLEGASGTAGEDVQGEAGIRLTDSLGRALPDVPVRWTARDGGSVLPAAERTDSLGQLRVRWTLGPKAGGQRLVATVGSGRLVPPVTVSATALPGAVASFAVASGGGQSAQAGAPLARAIVLRALDRAGNPVPGVPVTLAPAHGAVPDSAPVTDSTGAVRVQWTLGSSAGAQRLVARAGGLPPLALAARARPLAAVNVAFLDVPGEGPVGQTLPGTVRVVVTDAYGNPVPDALVRFAAGAGSATASRVMTDAEGHASTRWRLGARPGEQQLTATVKGDARATLSVQAVAPAKRTAAKPAAKPVVKPLVKPAAKPAARSAGRPKTARTRA